MSMKTITLKQVGWYFEGEAVINMWGGGQGSVCMTPWQTTGEFSEKEMVYGINDGQFGCESIDSAIVQAYRLYETGYKEFEQNYEYDIDELNRVQNHLKKGI